MTLKPKHIVEELNRTPKLKRDLIMKMMEVMLDSEAFLEAYPTLYDPCIADVDLEYREKVCEEMAQIIVRLFRKTKFARATQRKCSTGRGKIIWERMSTRTSREEVLPDRKRQRSRWHGSTRCRLQSAELDRLPR